MSKTTIKLNGVKTGDIIKLSPVMAESRRRFIAGIADNTPCEITIKAIRNPKSKQQLGAIFGLMLKQACIELDDLGLDTSYLYKLDKPTGIKIDEDALKEYLYSTCPIYDADGNRIGLSSSDMSQAAKFFDDSTKFLATQFSIFIPAPDPMWRNKEVKK